MTQVSGSLDNWPAIAARFRVISASVVLSLFRMDRCQDLRAMPLTEHDDILGLFFVSHRWESLSHPDPTGRQLRALQQLLTRTSTCIEAMLVDRDERLELVSSLSGEGWLQSEELARRLLGFGPFSNHPSWVSGEQSRARIRRAFAEMRGNRAAFRMWIEDRLGVWVDYLCMPQEPLSSSDQATFRLAMESLASLTRSSTVLTLRFDGDEYPTRGWCAMEQFVGSGRSFSRNIFVDILRMERHEDVALPWRPAPSDRGDPAAQVMNESFDQDREAFLEEIARWTQPLPPLIEIGPPDPWARYRDLQGSGFHRVEQDPNPFRRTLEAVREFETMLISEWLCSEQQVTIDLGRSISDMLQRFELFCSKPEDVAYVGLLMASNGWIDAFRPMLNSCVSHAVEQRILRNSQKATPIKVTLRPPNDEIRTLMRNAGQTSPTRWQSYLATGSGPDRHVTGVVVALRNALAARPLSYALS